MTAVRSAGPCLAATARAYLVEAVGVDAGFERGPAVRGERDRCAGAATERGVGQKLVRAHPRGNGGAWRTRDTCEWFFSGGRCRAASRSGPARAREHGMSLGGWDGASQCALGRWATAAHWLEANPKASINVASTRSVVDTCEWFSSGGRCRAASRSGPARAREHGMSRVGVGWSLTMRAWATAAHWGGQPKRHQSTLPVRAID